MRMKKIRLIVFAALLAMMAGNAEAQIKVHGSGLFNLKPGANVVVHDDTDGDVNVSGSITFDAGAELSLAGDWNNYGSFESGSGTVTFEGGAIQNIAGTVTSGFYDIHVNKGGGNLELGVETRISNFLRLLSNTFFVINTYNLVLGESAEVFGDMTNTSNDVTNPVWTDSKFISNDDGLSGGFVVKEISTTPVFPDDIYFPVGTSVGSAGSYTPSQVTIKTGTTVNPGAELRIKPVPLEHPYVEYEDVSLIKFWIFETSQLDISGGTADVRFWYVDTEVSGTEPDYEVLYYSPSLDPNGIWEINPGSSMGVDDPINRFYAFDISEIDGDWTAGERRAAQAEYWSIANGNYSDPSTWSRDSYGGPPSPDAPHKPTDIVHIGDNKEVTLNSAPSSSVSSMLIELEDPANPGVEVPGTFTIAGDYVITGDSLKLQENCQINIAHTEGIAETDVTGAIQTTVTRDFNQNATYKYFFNGDQITGDGLPSITKELIVGNAGAGSNTHLDLSKNLQIDQILTINNGTFDLNDFSLQGSGPGKTLDMTQEEAELYITGPEFPIYFTPQVFTHGTITYDGSASSQIATDNSGDNSVLGYKNLKIASSSPRTGNIEFETTGDINVSDIFDISDLNFAAPLNNRWSTRNSTFVFNGSGNQDIPTRPGGHTDLGVFLEYGNLRLETGGIKSLNDATPVAQATVLNDLTINTGTTLSLNVSNLEVQENWDNNDGYFSHDDLKVIFNPQTGVTSTGDWTVRTNNIFYDVDVTGDGTFQPQNEMTIDNDFRIEDSELTNSPLFDMSHNILVGNDLFIGENGTQQFASNTLTLNGNWENDGGVFTPNTSTVLFQSSSGVQTLTTASGTGVEEFYNLHINNSDHLDAHTAADGVKVNISDGLNLIDGKLITRDYADPNAGSWVEIVGDVQGESADRFVDGEMRKELDPTNTATTYTFEVGHNFSYTPVEITFNGAGTNTPGSSGIVGIVSDTLTGPAAEPTAREIYDNGIDEILPTDSDLDYDLTIRRQWWLKAPTGSSFVLNDNQYNATLNYIPYNGPGDENDIPNGDADSWMGMDPRLWTGSSWIKPTPRGRWDGTPAAGDRTTSSSSFQNLSDFGHIAIGHADPMIFYSYVHGGSTGDWDDPESWSVFGYDYGYAPRYPTQDGYLDDMVFIGGNDAGGPYDDEIFVNIDITNYTGTVTVETDGKLSFEGQNYIADDGSSQSHFYLEDAGILGVSHSNGITDAPTADGNIRTGVREYNYNSHDNAHIIFRDSQDPQVSGNGVPNTIGTLTIEKGAGTEVTLQNNLTIENYWIMETGDLAAGADITLNGHLTRESGAGFDPGTNEVTFAGDFDNTVTDNDNLLTFHDVTINKPNSGNVILAEDSPIQIGDATGGSLTFDGTNQAYLDARSFDDAVTRNYVKMGEGASISGAGKEAGWVNGELRMYFEDADAPSVKFEIGTDDYYSPMELDFLSAAFSNGGSDDGGDGYLSGYAYPGFHPALLSTYSPPIGQDKAVPRYWRLGLPPTSTFDRGERNFVKTIYYNDPEDLSFLDTWNCTDMSFITDWDLTPPGDFANWVTMYSISCGYNSNDNTGTNCQDTKDCSPTSNWYRYYGNTDNEIAYTRAGLNGSGDYDNYDGTNGVDHPFGSDALDDGSELLGDFVVGWQNSGQNTYYSFYSIVDDGDWTDPDTWSTVSFSSTVNDAIADTDHPGYPAKQYDNAAIGNNKRVILDESIGHGRYWGYEELYHYAGPVVEVQATGTLAFGIHVLRGNAFTAKSNSTLEIGTISGINNENDHDPFDPDSVGRGNILSGDRSIENNVNFVFTAEGVNSETDLDEPGTRYNYCWPGFFFGITGFWISDVQISTTPLPGTVLMDNNTGSDDRLATSYLYKSASVTPGETYNITVDVNNGGTNHLRVWIDFDRDGQWENNATERVVNNTFAGTQASYNFDVPTGLDPGLTQMRIQYRGNRSSGLDPCNSNWVQISEVEDYTIVIEEPATPPALTQVNGTAVPYNIASIEVKTPRTTAPGLSVFELQRDLNVRDYVQITAGTFTVDDSNVDQIALEGDFINYVEDGFVPETIEVLLDGTVDQNIAGTETIDFYDLTMDKASGEVIQSVDVNIANEMDFQEDNIYNIVNDTTLTIEEDADIIATGGDFSENRMIEVTGDEKTSGSNTGTIVKEFLTGSGSSQTFTYPIGTDGDYNPVDIEVPASLSGSPSFAINLHIPEHPDFLSSGTNYLRKYWEVSTTDIDPITSLKFYYNQSDVFGDQAEYIPGYYYPAHVAPGDNGDWEIDIGTNPDVIYTANPADDWYISLTSTQPLTGDITVADPFSYFTGRNYYSKIPGTGTGNWDIASNWSAQGHADTDYPSSYYPGELYENDVVYIDGNDQIDFNISEVTIESLTVANTAPSISGTTGTGTLNFVTDGSQMLITSTTYSIDMANTSAILADATGGESEIEIYGSLINESSGTGFDLFSDASNNVALKFSGTTSVNIEGNGTWTDLDTVIVEKSLPTDVVQNLSGSLATGSQGFNNNYLWDLDEGVFRHNVAGDILLSGGANALLMGDGSALESLQGSVSTNNDLVTNNNTYLLLNGGDLLVGDAENEHLLYRTGTEIDILNNSDLEISGAFARNSAGSSVDFDMTTGTTVRVNNDPDNTHSNTGFDISNTTSSFTMDGGEIIVVTGSASASSDYNVNATNGGLMTAGTITSGDGSTSTPDDIKFTGSMQIENFHIVGDGSANTNTQLVGNITIDDFWEIEENNTFDFNANTAELHGDLANAGTFDHTSGTLLINGSAGDQSITNTVDTEINFYNLTLDKTVGDLILAQGASGETNLLVHNNLVFADNVTPANANDAIINAYDAGFEVTLLSSQSTSLSRINNAEGHIYGRLNRYIPSGPQTRTYHIGGPVKDDWRRTIYQSVPAADGAPGNIGVINYQQIHEWVEGGTDDYLFVQYDSDIEEYWNVNSPGTYSLGTDGTFSLTTYFPSTVPSFSGNINEYEHFIYTPACPDLPAGCGADPGDWDFTVMNAKGVDGSYVYLESIEHTDFGDFVAAIPDGLDFYSIDDGSWDDSSIWSHTGYGGPNDVAGEYPGSNGRKADNIFVGDSKEVIIPSSFTDSYRYAREINVEDAASGPGELYIEGDDKYIRVDEFNLDNDCLLAVQNLSGIRHLSNPNQAAIRMRSGVPPVLGVSRYKFYGDNNQVTSAAFPDNVAAIIVDNTGAVSDNTVFISFLAGLPTITVQDSIFVNKGIFDSYDRDIVLMGDFYLENDGEFVPGDESLELQGDYDHEFRLDNAAGLQLYDLVLNFDGGASNDNKILLTRPDEPTSDNEAHLYIENDLTFEQAVIIDGRDAVRKVILETAASSVVQNDTEDGWVDGYLGKYFSSGDNQAGTKFEIGYEDATDEDYDPVTVSFTSTASGIMEAIVYKDFPNDPDNNENYGHRMDPDHRVPRWWNIQGYDDIDLGASDVNVLFEYPAAFNGSLTGDPGTPTEAVIRRKAIPSETPLWSERGPAPEISWNVSGDPVSVNISSTATNWAGIGDFFIGDKYPRAFYSLNTGNWYDYTNWTFESDHSGPAVPSGAYPGSDPLELEDDAFIGYDGSLGHQIGNLPGNITMGDITIRGSGELDLFSDEDSQPYTLTSSNSGTFSLIDNGTLFIGGTDIDLSTSLFGFGDFIGDGNSTVHFDGIDQVINRVPTNWNYTGLTSDFVNITLSGTGTKSVLGEVPLIDIDLRGDLRNNTGSTLVIDDCFDALSVFGNVINAGAIENEGVIEIGQ